MKFKKYNGCVSITLLFCVLQFAIFNSKSFATAGPDDICDATSLTVDAACSAEDNLSATAVGDPDGSCWVGSDPAQNTTWYTFIGPATGWITISTDNGTRDFNTQLAFYISDNDLCSGTLTEVACDDDDGAGTSSVISTGVISGQTYFVQLDGYSSDIGNYCLDITSTVPAGAGETCESPFVMDNNASVSNNTTGAGTQDYTDASYECGASMADMFYQITLPYTCNQLDLTFTSAMGGNLNLMILDDECSSIRERVCELSPATISFPGLDAGTYNILVSGATAEGAFTLENIVTDLGSPPLNDDCASPTELTAGAGNGIGTVAGDALSTTNLCATVELDPGLVLAVTDMGGCTYLEPPAPTEDQFYYTGAGLCQVGNISGGATRCWPSVENTVWYEFTATATEVWFIQLYNQSCASGVGVQFLITTVKDCANAENTAAGMMDDVNLDPACTSNINDDDIYLEIDVVDGTTYYIAVDGYAGDACDFDFLTGPTLILPVSLIYFGGEVLDGASYLRWTTSLERNNDYFTIEHSVDVKEFIEIGRIEGAGSTNEITNYNFIDYNPVKGFNYYRLKQTDYDGHSSNSKIIVIDARGKKNIEIETLKYYNDGIGIAFYSGKCEVVDISIYDISGRVVKNITSDVEIGYNEIKFNIEDLSKGLYLISIKDKNGGMDYSKFVKY